MIVAAAEAARTGPKTTEPVIVEPNTMLPNTAGGASPGSASTLAAVNDAPLDARRCRCLSTESLLWTSIVI